MRKLTIILFFLVLAFSGWNAVTQINQSQVNGLVSALAGKVSTTTTVNGHALSSNVTVTPTDLDASVSSTEYGYINTLTSNAQTQIDGKQALDGDLTTLAALTATTGNMILAASSAWTSATPATVKTALSLNNVENTALSTWAGTTNITTLGTITGGTLSTGAVIAGVTMTLGSDATGNMYYRNSSGVLTKITAGAQNTVLKMGASSVPGWSTETYAAPGTSGNVMQSDGTNWTSATPSPRKVASANISATSSATSTTGLYTPTADGMYRISIYLKITTTGNSPVAGPVTITYTDADGSVAQSHVMLLQSVTGSVVTTTVNNSTTTGTVNGSMVVYAKASVSIGYAIAVSGTFGAGRYTAHLTCEAL